MKKINLIMSLLTIFACLQLSVAGTLPLNTGYDYANYTTYPTGTVSANEEYWIRIASYPVVNPAAVGNTWAVAPASGWATPMTSGNLIPSTYINAFGNSLNGSNPTNTVSQNPSYALYRKCFCLPEGYKGAKIQGSVRSDETVNIWLNSLSNIILPPSPLNVLTSSEAHNFSYSDQNKFRVGSNCIYVWVEDTGWLTGFNLVGNVTTTNNTTPVIAKGIGMSFAPCSCNQGTQGTLLQKKYELEEKEAIREIVKFAEAKRIERKRINNPKN